MARRAIVIVLDSVGVGQAPDAAKYGDEGANTIANVAKATGGLVVPNMSQLGLGRITPIQGASPDPVCGAYGCMIPKSVGKDTTNGHMEFVGVTLSEPLPTYPHGFPPEIIEPFVQTIGSSILGNVPASGTEIIAQLGDEHVRTGHPIVYTSGDSVLQIAAHEEIVPVNRLYWMCEVARALLVGKHAVGRVIARPFVGTASHYTRTANRRDFSRDFGPTLLTALTERGVTVTGIGKIEDIYAGEGISLGIHTDGNDDGMTKTIRVLEEQRNGDQLVFTNLVDFDMLYGHRRDARGFADAIEAFDRRLPEITQRLHRDDLLLITADHGCDPTTPGTDHSREGVPILAYRPGMSVATDLGRRETFADLGATIAAHLGLAWSCGRSFFGQLNVQR